MDPMPPSPLPYTEETARAANVAFRLTACTCGANGIAWHHYPSCAKAVAWHAVMPPPPRCLGRVDEEPRR